jgi:ELWxxDGT repeat protein
MFAAADATCGAEPWMTSGTWEGSQEVFDLRPGPASSNPREFTRVGDLVFFSADDGEGHELWAAGNVTVSARGAAVAHPGTRRGMCACPPWF